MEVLVGDVVLTFRTGEEGTTKRKSKYDSRMKTIEEYHQITQIFTKIHDRPYWY